MSFTTYHGTDIRVACPVHAISVNKHKVAFADQFGQKLNVFTSTKEAKAFVSWLLTIH
jgi:hypothetical protein